MKKIFLLLLLSFLFYTGAFSQQSIGIGTTTPHASAILEIKSFTKGLIFPRTSSTSRLAMTGVKGLFVYDTTFNQVYYHNGTSWQLISNGNYWTPSGNNIYSNNSGNVGIGVTNPTQKLAVLGAAMISGNPPSLYMDGTGSATTNRIFFDLATNTMDFVLLHFSNTFYISRQTGAFGFVDDFTMNENGYVGIGSIDAQTRLHVEDGTDVGNASGGFLQLGASDNLNIGFDNNEIQGRNNGVVSRLVLNNGGGPVQIGSAVAPAGYSLAVNGKVICEELKIQASSNWPDYVFGKSYSLKSLDELKSFISTHHHLPNIPSADEIEKEGILIGDMQKKMMEKIEELTLYILQLEEKYTNLRAELETLKSEK